jgi:cell division cycle 20-like protein 1 (cofactor of APC complex)
MNTEEQHIPFQEIWRNSTDKKQPSTSKFFSPSPATKEKLGDRFIPCKINTQLSFLNETENDQKQFEPYSQILQSQLFSNEAEYSDKKQNILQFKNEFRKSDGTKNTLINTNDHEAFGQNFKQRKISKAPYKILDAPSLQDDFYLNLVDWSSNNILAVGLSNSVYVWSACTSKVSKLTESPESITSIAWNSIGNTLAVGLNNGELQLWDYNHCKLIRSMLGHTARVSSCAWNGVTLSTGSRDRSILVRDPRVNDDFTSKLIGHKQEVCGLKWSFDGTQLASGGNDNKLFLWDAHSSNPLAKFSDHQAAVKAIGWSPHQRGLLASGGGTADRQIKFWNTLTLECIKSIDTGSQVCNLMFSKTTNELVSTHGYSLNQIILWKYPSLTKIATLIGHTYRVLFLSMSPNGESIITGAGDETLRFWNVFPPVKSSLASVYGHSTNLLPSSMDVR